MIFIIKTVFKPCLFPVILVAGFLCVSFVLYLQFRPDTPICPVDLIADVPIFPGSNQINTEVEIAKAHAKLGEITLAYATNSSQEEVWAFYDKQAPCPFEMQADNSVICSGFPANSAAHFYYRVKIAEENGATTYSMYVEWVCDEE